MERCRPKRPRRADSHQQLAEAGEDPRLAPRNQHEEVDTCCQPPCFRSLLQSLRKLVHQPTVQVFTEQLWLAGGRISSRLSTEGTGPGPCHSFLPPALRTLSLTQACFCSSIKEPPPAVLWPSTQLCHLDLQVASCRPPFRPT